MVLMCDPIFSSVESIEKFDNSLTILLTPQGKPFNQEIAKEFIGKDQLIMICGHYEGFDERIREGLSQIHKDENSVIEISIGDFVLTGGELAALSIIDSVTRLIPGSLGKDESAHYDTFASGLLEYPQYTRPAEYREMKVPEVLLSGNHQEIAKYRRAQEIIRTYRKRPDLFKKFEEKGLTKEDKQRLDEYLNHSETSQNKD